MGPPHAGAARGLVRLQPRRGVPRRSGPLLRGPVDHADAVPGLVTLAVFIVETTVLTALAGGSFGKLATRLRVVRHDGSGRPVGLLPALARTLLVALVIPPLVFRPDGRGLHDMMAGTATVTLQTLRAMVTGQGRS